MDGHITFKLEMLQKKYHYAYILTSRMVFDKWHNTAI